jgi:hypothetical protein
MESPVNQYQTMAKVIVAQCARPVARYQMATAEMLWRKISPRRLIQLMRGSCDFSL